MRNILHVLRMCFLFLACVTALPVFAATEISLVQEFTVTEASPSLYRAWARNDASYKQAHPWSVVWKENCDRLNIPCTDAAWKKIPVGQKFYLPAPTILVVVPDKEVVPESVAIGTEVHSGLFALIPTQEAPSTLSVKQLEDDVQHLSAVLNATMKERDLQMSITQVFAVLLLLTSIALVFCLVRMRISKRCPRDDKDDWDDPQRCTL